VASSSAREVAEAKALNVTDAPKPMSLRQYAKRRTPPVSPEAVSKAITDGRLVKSVVRDERGAPKISDAELADQEWAANTRIPPVAPDEAQTAALLASRTTREAAEARRASAQAELAEIELEEKRGQLIDRDEARGDVIKAFSLVKTKLLAIPSQVGQELPELADQVVPLVEKLIREALDELVANGSSNG
jgi:phage terminase Nu1 subunit (DNA packaging protein)